MAPVPWLLARRNPAIRATTTRSGSTLCVGSAPAPLKTTPPSEGAYPDLSGCRPPLWRPCTCALGTGPLGARDGGRGAVARVTAEVPPERDCAQVGAPRPLRGPLLPARGSRSTQAT